MRPKMLLAYTKLDRWSDAFRVGHSLAPATLKTLPKGIGSSFYDPCMRQ
jgi:hypothetical protein